MDELIARAVPSTVQTVDATALGDYCSPNTIPSDPALWGKGWVRVVGVGGMVCPCGGTHVADTRELGRPMREEERILGSPPQPAACVFRCRRRQGRGRQGEGQGDADFVHRARWVRIPGMEGGGRQRATSSIRNVCSFVK